MSYAVSVTRMVLEPARKSLGVNMRKCGFVSLGETLLHLILWRYTSAAFDLCLPILSDVVKPAMAIYDWLIGRS
jgi:hypothetical protein